MMRIDTHHHAVPSFYRDLLQKTGMDKSGGRAVPEWSPESSLVTMAELGVATAILSVSTPGTTILTSPADSAALARDLNDYLADLVAAQRDRFGFFATIPMPHIGEAVDEVVRSLDKLHADGVVLLGNSAGTYLGQDGQDDLFAALDARSAVVFIHPGDLRGAAVAGIPPFAADFLLDTTRAAFLLVRNEIRRNYPRIRFILSHAGGFVPYASHRMAVAIMGDTGRGLNDILDDFAGFYFDTALSSTAAALPSLLAFAKPGHVTFGSDFPFAPIAAAKLFAAGLETYPGLGAEARVAIERTNALRLFPRLGTAAPPPADSAVDQVRHAVSRVVMRGIARLTNAR